MNAETQGARIVRFRGIVLASALVTVSSATGAAELSANSTPAEVVPLAENLHIVRLPEVPRTVMLVLTGPDGTVLVDHENPDLGSLSAGAATAARVDEALSSIGALPVRFLINTHWHPDHVGGNERFGGDALIVSHAATRDLLAARQAPFWLPEGVGPMPAKGLPHVTFDESMSLHLNGEEIELFHFGAAHTDGDAVVWLKRAGVAHMGDLFHGLDNPAVGDDMEGLAAFYERLLARLPADVRLVTGHGPVTDLDELERHHRMLVDVIAWMKEGRAAGMTLEELAERPLPPPWNESWTGSARARLIWLDAIYRSLSERGPRDRDRLLDLHREGLEAHLERDVDKLLAAEGAETVFVSRGEISRPTLEERREMFSGYFGSTEFVTYRDTVEPIVRISDDGSLGWVIARVEASGMQTRRDGETGELRFTSAWIELYEKRDGEWLRIGNVSNFSSE